MPEKGTDLARDQDRKAEGGDPDTPIERKYSLEIDYSQEKVTPAAERGERRKALRMAGNLQSMAFLRLIKSTVRARGLLSILMNRTIL